MTADSSGEIKLWDVLEFLKEVESITQDYPLEGLKALSVCKISQRIICIETYVRPQREEAEKEEVEGEGEVVDDNDDEQYEIVEPKKNKKINKKKA